MLIKRSNSPEIMDDLSVEDDRLTTALKELRIINKYLGGRSATREGIRLLTENNSDSSFSVLDAGSGGADVFNNLTDKLKLKICSLDRNKQACRYIKEEGLEKTVICADVLSLPVKDKSFQIVHTSLFLHHFTMEQLKEMLENFKRISVRGIIINDLRRTVLAYWGIKLLTVIFSSSDMVKNDAPLSVKRGFTLKELKQLFETSGISAYVIKRKWAFRWLVIIKCS